MSASGGGDSLEQDLSDRVELSYRQQSQSEHAMGMPSRFTRPGSIDNWRHTRMLDFTKPLWRAEPASTWMTVGDGRYGSDAAYLHSHGVRVTATSLTDERLRHAQERGFIGEYHAENAERIGLDENAVDYILCKEAYHHFPRPPVALYEMLRVARKAVVLIEPLDNPRFLDGLKNLVKFVLRGTGKIDFEPSGNYLYRINLRELAKLMSAVNMETIAYRGINDFFHERFAQADAGKWGAASCLTRLGIGLQDGLARLHLLGYGLACVVVFKGRAGPSSIDCLEKAGYRIVRLPRNPYIGQA